MKKSMKAIAAMMLMTTLFFAVGCKPDEPEVVYGSIFGTVTDFATGEPVSNVNVKLRPIGESTLTGNDGTFEFVDLDAGKYSLMLSKAEYADLDDDHIIELEAGKKVRRDVQIRKRVASLKITDMSGNSLDTLDFGDQESVRVKTFNVFNDGTETLTCTVTYDCEWITNVTGLEKQIESGQTVPVTVRIDRVALSDGDNSTFLYITSANGSNELVVKATFQGAAVIKTKEPTNVGSNSATVGGKITDDGGRPVLVRGVCYGTSQSPDINGDHTEDGSGTGEFSHNLTGLQASTTYYARAYATNRNGTYYASNIVSFTTPSGLAKVTTDSVSNITSTTAKCGGNVTSDGGHSVTARGVCWNTTGSPDVNDSHTSNGSGTGAFTSNLANLSVGTTYYVRAYATNSKGTRYGEELTFTTNNGSVTVTTNTVSSITPNSAVSGGKITVPSGNTLPVTERGVCWSTSHNPNITGDHSSDGSGAGSFTSSITGLTVNTKYFVRAYATNQSGTFYGEEKSFTTTSGLPTVTTKEITDIAPLSANGGGNVTSDNGFTVTARGICWSTVSNPTIDDEHTTNGTGTGEFNSAISGLQHSTTYHLRAYATNSKGTAYGEDKTFTTTSGEISVTTNSVTGIGPSGATCGGNATVTTDNNLPITAKGVCWSTGHNPTVTDSHTTDGTGTGAFTSTISGLSINTLYYVRAYATNQLGTYYGQEKSFTTAVGLPAVTTTAPTLSGVTVTTGGNVTSDGGYTVTARGICYGSLPNPDLTSTYNHTTDGNGTGYFSSTFTLPGGSGRYYIRAYATNANGTVYGEQKSIIQPYDELPTFIYNGNTYRVAPEANNKLSWGNAKAFCENLTLYGYSDWTLPTQGELLQMYNDRVSIGGFGKYCYWSSTGSTYAVYIDFSSGNVANTNTGYYSNYSQLAVRPIRQETGGGTTPIAPTVTTSSPSNVTSSSATCVGNVTADGGATVTQRGVCYGTSQNPTTSNQTVTSGSGTGSFTCNLTGLSANTTYYVRAYAVNSAGTSYGQQQSFTTTGGSTPVPPTVTTTAPSSVTASSATCGGNVTADGGATVTQRGVCYGTSQNPTTSNQTVTSGSGTGSFTCNLTGLTANTTYYVRAYAKNSAGTAYGVQKSFKTTGTTPVVPTVTTTAASSVTSSSATCGGNVTADGGATVTQRGVCYGTSQNPTTSNQTVTSGSGTGSFTCNLTGLTANTTYYVRAYAKNSAGTAYGVQKSFKTTGTTPVVPTVTTTAASSVTSSSATCGGNVTADGGAAVTQRGVCYGTSQNPTTSNQTVTSGSGTGSFTCNLTGLTANTTYYVRAFATNSAGTSYGSQVSFTTKNETVSGWLYYDDVDEVVGHAGLTNGGTLYWANMFPPSMLAPYAGTSVVKIEAHLDITGSYVLQIYQGGNEAPSTLLFSGSSNVSQAGGYVTFTFGTPVSFDSSQNLWVVIGKSHSAGDYPAGYSNLSDEVNSRWCSLDGSSWGDSGYTWVLHTYVSNTGEKSDHTIVEIRHSNNDSDIKSTIDN